MDIAWNEFTPVAALLGGLLIGVATALYLLGNGLIADVSGIVASPLAALLARRPLLPERTRLLFVAGLLAAPWLWRLFAPLPVARIDVGGPLLVLGGLLVGVGVRMGNGCTSGHGVCGLSRCSPRSVVNVPAFMGAGVATVFAMRHLG